MMRLLLLSAVTLLAQNPATPTTYIPRSDLTKAERETLLDKVAEQERAKKRSDDLGEAVNAYIDLLKGVHHAESYCRLSQGMLWVCIKPEEPKLNSEKKGGAK